MTRFNIPPLREGKFDKGGLNPVPNGPPPEFHPAPMGIPFQMPNENGRAVDKQPPRKP